MCEACNEEFYTDTWGEAPRTEETTMQGPALQRALAMRCPSCATRLVWCEGEWCHAQQASGLCTYPTTWIGSLPVEAEDLPVDADIDHDEGEGS